MGVGLVEGFEHGPDVADAQVPDTDVAQVRDQIPLAVRAVASQGVVVDPGAFQPRGQVLGQGSAAVERGPSRGPAAYQGEVG
ncbi:hypothetical protein GCM10009679_59790 [Saccharothrix algeriensis]|uniref:Uncharacterized protein n=1 Tax=Catellatospora bangladeshensis TaxID=310355 RepID=A0A8J3NJJ5_9ACTN|nr:hypothetical protein Cba03nite_44760 [Catellatospora bangladeshensis]